MKKSILLIIASIICGQIWGQQYPLFSNYVTNCFGFNPAITGVDPGGEIRIMHRTQWTNFELNPETSLGNVTGRLGKLPIGVGATFYRDVAGRLNRNGGALSLAFHQKLGKNTNASVGGSFGYYKNLLQREYFAETPGDPILAKAAEGQWAPDFNLGLYIRHKNLYFGASTPQFLQRILNFKSSPDIPGESVLVRHYYAFAGYKIMFGKMYLEPSALVKFVQTAPVQWDGAVKLGTGTPLWLGMSYRNRAAAAAMAGLDLKNGLGLAYAYDLTASGLNKASSSSHEITLTYKWGKCKDKDGDGVCDKSDKCPDEPGPVEKEGCPDKKDESKEKCKDQDKDDICDDVDECPTLAGPAENKGCPYDDRDRDGVKDKDDKCPDVPGFKQYDGCPTDDRDNDGIRDQFDKCPDEPGPVTNYGCPFGKGDADGDGVPDEYDQCPNTPGIKEKNGCPDVTETDRAILNLAIQNLYFDTDQHKIKAPSKPHLDKLAKVLTSNRGWKIRIAGHADARGTNEHNLLLSKNRSEAVMYYLIARGVKREQLLVEYYGESVPLSDNKSHTGLAQNRRVEMEFIFN